MLNLLGTLIVAMAMLILTPCATDPNASAILERAVLAESQRSHAPMSWDAMPSEYFQDVDYIEDANDPLEGWPLSTSIPLEIIPRTTSVLPSSTTEAPMQNATANEPSNFVSFARCKTVIPPVESEFYKTADHGTPCLFGVDDRDERGHCIMDDLANHGVFGWCWTVSDRSVWGSCNEECPLFGQPAVLQKKLQKQQRILEHYKELLAQNKANITTNLSAEANGTMNATNNANESVNASANVSAMLLANVPGLFQALRNLRFQSFPTNDSRSHLRAAQVHNNAR